MRNFKVDTIKIDRSFIENLDDDSNALGLVRALMGLGHGLGLTVTAEGVEKPGQADTLIAQGCEHAQGFLYGRAMTAAEALDLLAARNPERALKLQAGAV